MNEPVTYEIVIRGKASTRVLGGLRDDFAIEATDAGTTRITGPIRDAAQLHGVVTHLTSLAIDIVSLVPLEPGRSPQPNPQAPEPPERKP